MILKVTIFLKDKMTFVFNLKEKNSAETFKKILPVNKFFHFNWKNEWFWIFLLRKTISTYVAILDPNPLKTEFENYRIACKSYEQDSLR